jgi:hypothetical protein
VSELPTNIWVRPGTVSGRYYTTPLRDDPDAVRYVRADLYEALMERMRVVRSWNEAPCLDPLGTP